jgi:hypothetical protein
VVEKYGPAEGDLDGAQKDRFVEALSEEGIGGPDDGMGGSGWWMTQIGLKMWGSRETGA